MVGACIVQDGQVIAEGFHHSPGSLHGEALALQRLPVSADPVRATLYVNLEPCCHEGRTSPCTERILEAGIGRVVFGTYDPSEKVAGGGIQRLKEGGCQVEGPVLEAECKALNRRFFTAVQKQRPYVILKWAQTLDGFIDRERTKGEKGINWITGKEAQQAVHRWRAEEDAILVGKETVRLDDPSLTARAFDGPDPLRILIDRQGTAPQDQKLFQEGPPTMVFTERTDAAYPSHLEKVTVDPDSDLLSLILYELHARDKQSLIVEGGSKVLNSFIRSGLWDEARILVGDRWFGTGKSAPTLKREPDQKDRVGNDQLLVFRKQYT